jgi:SulP family sulfate permease
MRNSRKYFGSIKRLLWDISGAFGDIGVLFPLAVALIAKNHFNPTALFLMAGLFYIASAYYFKITMPVQPLKAMAAIAIATGLSVEVMNAAGVAMGVILILISLTGLGIKLGQFFPVSVIRGIQLGLGLMLIKASKSLINADIFIALLSGAILLACVFMIKKIPPLIPLIILGIIFSLKGIQPAAMGPVALTLELPGFNNLWTGFIVLVLPQIALTFGNAIVATEATGKMLYGDRAERLTLRNIPMSMGVANIASGIIGGSPMCHGCGGLTAHYKFGAASEKSGYIIGIILIVLAVLFGSSSLSIISAFPKGILGVLLCYVGIQHSLFVRDILLEKQAVVIALTVAALGFITNNLTIGFLAGIGIHYGLKTLTWTINLLKE